MVFKNINKNLHLIPSGFSVLNSSSFDVNGVEYNIYWTTTTEAAPAAEESTEVQFCLFAAKGAVLNSPRRAGKITSHQPAAATPATSQQPPRV